MKKYCKALVNLGVAAVILAAVLFLLPRLFLFFMPFVAGWIIALIASPLVRFFEEKVKLKRKAGSAFVIIVIIALVVLMIYIVCAQLFEQIIGLGRALPEMMEGMESDLESIGKNLNLLLARLPGNIQLNLGDRGIELESYLGELLERFGSPTIEAAGNLAKLLPGIFIGMIMALLSAYFFVAERHQLNEWFWKHMPASVKMRYRVVRHSLGKSVGGYFKAQLKIEVWMYFLLLLGLGILRVNYFGLIALGIAILDFLPFLGTGTVLIPWAVIRILTAQYQTAIGLLVIWGVGQLARQLIQPKIVGDSIGVPPLPTLFLLYIGYKVGGVIGMILAVPLGLLVYSLYQDGAFDTTKNSVLVLTAGINRFRRLEKEDMAEVEEMHRRNEEEAKRLEEAEAQQEPPKKKKAEK
ncbi:MAG: sporulation integral membrane protein YtvI [Lachnospiraceae bacterium]|uniref:sporulation integral membrane protein YtvI n=1 Tax=uncultured Acetatifactor sp. TaxID=1671927 RepID=UPI0026270A4A|nr:sporulation integral membrane protein YtvI [uncultured Acetatifactor sp.]MCI8788388.1 sporulation integral membrane protein YtvI [Lachnospiraceae bacterium]